MLNLKVASIALLVLLAACEQKAVPLEKVMPPPLVKPLKPKELVLSMQSVGPVTFGVPLSEVEISLGQAMRLDETDDPECSFVSFKALPKVRLMVERGVVTRADVDAEISNTSGIKVGDTEEQLKQQHPTLKVAPHKTVAGRHILTLPGEGKAAMVMETDGTRVTRIRAGLQPSVSSSEGCL